MTFKRRVLKNYFNIGSICRSSKFLYQKMTEDIDFNKDLSIVEFGPGDGVFTDELLKKVSTNSKISIFEIDEHFYNILKEKYKNDTRVIIYNLNANQIIDYFEEESIDYIISSLPLAFIEKCIVGEILEKSKYTLKSKGKFIQYQYFLQNIKQIKYFFPKIDYKFTVLNFPPAFIYICHK